MINKASLRRWFEQLPFEDRPAFLFDEARQAVLPDGSEATEMIGSGREIAQREGLHHSTVNELLRLTLLGARHYPGDPGWPAAPLHEPAVVSAEPAADRLDWPTGGCGGV